MKTKPRPRAANDNGEPTIIVSLQARRECAARRGFLMRDWAPAILATFFGETAPTSPHAARHPRRRHPSRR